MHIMRQVTVHEAETHLSRLLDEVQAGEEIIVARGREPVARSVPLKPSGGRRIQGRDKGKFKVPKGFMTADSIFPKYGVKVLMAD